jgi:hypothetical protein
MKNKYFCSVIIFIFIFMLASCGGSPEAQQPPADTPAPVAEAPVSEPTPAPEPEPNKAEEDVPTGLVEIAEPTPEPSPEPVMFTIPEPDASGINVSENEKALLDYSNSSDGYVMVKFLEETTRNLRVQITPPAGEKHLYVLRADGEFSIFPLASGNGNYQIEVYQGAPNGAYSMVLTEAISVTLKDEFEPFLRPNYYVNYDENNAAIKYAWDLTKSLPSDLDKVAAVYKYVTENITYDMALTNNSTGYVPNIDNVMKEGIGICFDYAVLMTAMLRSQGIPTKLIFGYVGSAGVYHAWINVYTKESGWVDVVQFNGSQWVLMDPTFAASLLDDSSALEQFIGDGSNYTVRYVF